MIAALSPGPLAAADEAGDPAGAEASFRGWQGIRVVEQPGQPKRLGAVDIDGDGQHRLVVVNPRKARLAIYRWQGKDKRAKQAPAADESDEDNPNALPMAPELDRTLITTEQLPQDVLAHDVDGDDKAELVVLVSGPGKVLVYDRQAADEANGDDEQAGDPAWQQTREWDLLDGSFTGRGGVMLLRRPDDESDDPASLLVSFDQGIQTLKLEPGARPQWLEPKAGDRNRWWLLDLEGDGERDLVTWSRSRRRAVRWYEPTGDAFRPPQVVLERSADHAAALPRLGEDQPAEVLLLGGQQSGLVRRYRFAKGESNPLGQWQALHLPGGDETPWAGVRIEGQRALVASDPDRPRLMVHTLDDGGWMPADAFPAVSNIRAMVAPRAKPDTLLIWTRDAGNLYRSRWQKGRFTYPKVEPFKAEASDRKIIALDQTGETTWWVQRVGEHLDLYTWSADEASPSRERFEDVGAKVNEAQWLGGKQLLVKEQYARHPKLVEKRDGDVEASQPAHVKQMALAECRLYAVGDAMKPALVSDGVLRWLDADLHADDQIMLEGGQDLISYVPIDGSGKAWALQRGGEFVHKLKPDEAGIPRLEQRLELPGGQGLSRDPVLGLVLTTGDGVVRLAPGKPPRLEVAGSIKGDEDGAGPGDEPSIHRLLTTDVTGDGQAELILADDRRHELKAMARDGGALVELISWPVFDDRAYPYGGGGDSEVTQPRAILGLDIDGDGHQDLAMLSHDRLILYLGREPAQ